MKIEQKEINIPVGETTITGNLDVPEGAQALVIFSHGSGSSRFSPRNKFVAQHLQQQGLATLLIDLLTKDEDKVYANRFNIDLLTQRLVAVSRFTQKLPEYDFKSVGYFGASTGAASALKAAALLHEDIQAVVSRGGRPDLAAGSLVNVKAPTLLIVGSLDTDVIALNQKAMMMMECEKKIVIVQGASHLFEERGKLEEAAHIAAEWFSHYLIPVHIH